MDKEPEEKVMIMEAIEKAEKAFQEHLRETYNMNTMYFSFRVEVCRLDASLTLPLTRIVYEDPVRGKDGKFIMDEIIGPISR